ncbi:MAG: hypothetical protein HY044_04615 [Candidatus Woesebacteria bacterium]|nr:MAG: hypothetical protein HY044_04615 [Candidatus Woesebacteria bacterium]
MTKKIFIFSFIVFLFLSFVYRVKASDFDKALSDYKASVDIYQKADNDYQLARSQYLSSQTLASQQKAQQATYAFLKARDDVISTYLSMLRQKITDTKGIGDNDKNGFYGRIDSDVSFYIDHRDKIPSAGSLTDLFSDSDKARDHYNKITLPLIYRILATLPDGTVQVFLGRITDIIGRISTKTSEIKKDKDTQTIERWIIETQNRVDRAKDKESSILTDLPKIETVKDPFSSYNSFLGSYDETIQYLKEANIYLKEIVKNIMTN